MKLKIISFTESGARQTVLLKKKLKKQKWNCEGYTIERHAKDNHLKPLEPGWKEMIKKEWGETDFLFIGAIGIALRVIAPFVDDKYKDSAVIVMDELGQYVIPILSGHVGGGIALAKEIGKSIGGEVVITTATDLQNKFAVDVFASQNRLKISNRQLAKEISAALLEGKSLRMYCEYPIQGNIPSEIVICNKIQETDEVFYDIIVGKMEASQTMNPKILYLTPQQDNYVVGIGCRKGASKEVLEDGFGTVLAQYSIPRDAVKGIVSIDLKEKEQGIIALAQEYSIPFKTYSSEALDKVQNVSKSSPFVKEITGVDNVCERAARTYFEKGQLICPKTIIDGVTYAIVKEIPIMKFS
ncbi:cobalt-precorrin 5A hydrolase [Aequitasia blattaphilus]|uniref:Cobalamin biosynthesis protein n=1 Tax=Aequitasia blattaphilus TaxID=2949332 RepID=A0ABT1EB74_9FIRM|nr:cobalamin biosynthesis protein [Aequitasia blattaphilus]MCP1102182.1 cobalamin biosynthesis protein [Aequitasia blattaphilus]MCR8614822.1 cobalamin biosynthesis protein [Aequitasia blattaphilus]